MSIDKNDLNIQIIHNTQYIQYAQSLYKDIHSLVDKINFLQYIAIFMTYNVTSYFKNSFLEQELNTISQNLKFNLSENFVPNTVLHVMTEAYSIGGHTKLLELMIQNTSADFQKQSLLISNPQSEIPLSLQQVVQKHGELTVLQDIDIIQKAQQLATIASNYQYVVLHIHQDDILPNLAFGNTNFQRPVIFMNHADHMFWCGISISDLVLDLSHEGNQFSKSVRGAKSSQIVYIPIEQNSTSINQAEARKYLNLDKNKKIILSIASEYKYGTTHEDIFKFVNMGVTILNNVSNSEFLIIGPSIENSTWAEAKTVSKNRIKPLGRVERKLIDYYIAASDLYIESFPFASYTAYLDTVRHNINILSLKTPIFTQDIVIENNLLANSIHELENSAIKILNQKNKETPDIDLSIHLQKYWAQNFSHIIHTNLPKNHSVYDKAKTSEADNRYLNHIQKAIGGFLILNQAYTKLPFLIKFQLAIGMIQHKLIKNFKEFKRLFRKVFTIQSSKIR